MGDALGHSLQRLAFQSALKGMVKKADKLWVDTHAGLGHEVSAKLTES